MNILGKGSLDDAANNMSRLYADKNIFYVLPLYSLTFDPLDWPLLAQGHNLIKLVW